MTRLLLPISRAGWGLVLLRRPERALTLLGAPSTGEQPRAVARVLGVRHLAQATVELLSARPRVRRVTASVDVLHAATGLLLAADRRWRRTGLSDAGLAASFAVLSRR